jgi:hypothetical protein
MGKGKEGVHTAANVTQVIEVVYVKNIAARLACSAWREMPLARISWLRTSVQYNDYAMSNV